MTILSYFIFWCSGFALLLSFGELWNSKNSSRKYYLSFVFFFLFLFLLQSFLHISELIFLFPHFLFTHVFGILLLGPFLERYINLVWENKVETFTKFLLKCLFSLSFSLFIIPIFFKNSNEKILYLHEIYLTKGATKFILVIIASNFLFYMLKLGFQFFKLFRKNTLIKNQTLQLILFIITLGIIVTLIGIYYIIQDSKFSLTINGVLIGIFLILLFLIRIRNPNILYEVKLIIEDEKKYKISQLKNLDLSKIHLELKRLFEVEKIYREEEISLSELAGRLEINTHQLSEFLNGEWKMSFSQILNKYRVDEAKKLLLLKKKDTVLSIAYEVGFQTKSNFNDTFKKETGYTPTMYRKKFSTNDK